MYRTRIPQKKQDFLDFSGYAGNIASVLLQVLKQDAEQNNSFAAAGVCLAYTCQIKV